MAETGVQSQMGNVADIEVKQSDMPTEMREDAVRITRDALK